MQTRETKGEGKWTEIKDNSRNDWIEHYILGTGVLLKFKLTLPFVHYTPNLRRCPGDFPKTLSPPHLLWSLPVSQAGRHLFLWQKKKIDFWHLLLCNIAISLHVKHFFACVKGEETFPQSGFWTLIQMRAKYCICWEFYFFFLMFLQKCDLKKKRKLCWLKQMILKTIYGTCCHKGGDFLFIYFVKGNLLSPISMLINHQTDGAKIC